MNIGVLGGGQLGRMLALAGHRLGMSFRFLDRKQNACAGDVGQLISAPFDDHAAVDRFSAGLDVATYEFENIPVETVDVLAQRVPVHPGINALRIASDRWSEKQLFVECDVPVTPYVQISSKDELEHAVQTVGLPAVIKTRRMGYDGKGLLHVHNEHDVRSACDQFEQNEFILEQLVKFDREVSVIGVRDVDGNTVIYPLVENHHRAGILVRSIAPATNVTESLQHKAETHFRAIAEALGYVGVLAVEFFEKDGALYANEMAPRVHNTGHWTIDGAATSQFENHLRAIAGLPLGSTEPRGHSVMVNLIGGTPPLASMLEIPGVNVHLYHKTPRPGRKIGHVTKVVAQQSDIEAAIQQLEKMLETVPAGSSTT